MICPWERAAIAPTDNYKHQKNSSMKKFLLSVAVFVSMAFTAAADIVVDGEQSFEGMTKYPFYVMGYEPAITDGVLIAEYPGEWYQFFVADGIKVTPGTDYTVTTMIRGSKAGSFNVQMGTWGSIVDNTLTIGTEWAECSAVFSGIEVESSFVVFQPGTYDGKIEIKWVKVTHDGEPLPTTGNVLASFYSGNDKTLGGWGGSATFENVDYDGKPCLKFTNPEATDSWGVQMAIDYEFQYGTTYYLGFDIKGTPAKGIDVSFQGKENYEGKGSMTKFNITDEWQHVIVYGEPSTGTDADNPVSRLLFNLGAYAGTFHITDVKLYTKSEIPTAIDLITAPADNSRTVVYNLMGVKVLDTTDESDLRTLAPGIYVVNGKKTVISNR